MGTCGSCGGGGGPFSVGRELVEFVYNAHGGTVCDQLIPNGGLPARCQGCGAEFILTTFMARLKITEIFS